MAAIIADAMMPELSGMDCRHTAGYDGAAACAHYCSAAVAEPSNDSQHKVSSMQDGSESSPAVLLIALCVTWLAKRDAVGNQPRHGKSSFILPVGRKTHGLNQFATFTDLFG